MHLSFVNKKHAILILYNMVNWYVKVTGNSVIGFVKLTSILFSFHLSNHKKSVQYINKISLLKSLHVRKLSV